MKKIIRNSLLGLLCIAVIVGGIFLFKIIGNSSKHVSVTPVQFLNAPYFGSENNYYGYVISSDSQKVMVSGDKQVKQILVEEGQQVKSGDVLVQLDTDRLNIEFEQKKLTVEIAESNVLKLQSQLTQIQNLPIIADQPILPEPTPSEPVKPDKPKVEKVKENDAFNILDSITDMLAETENSAVLGSKETPYKFLLSSNSGKVMCSLIEQLKGQSNSYALIEVKEGNVVTGNVLGSWFFDAKLVGACKPEDTWMVLPTPEETIKEETIQIEPITVEPEVLNGVTAAEKSRMIKEKQREISSAIIEQKRLELDLRSTQNQLQDGQVKALRDGVVKKVAKLGQNVNYSEPIVEVVSGLGTMIQAEIDEFSRETLKVGDLLTAFSYETGETYEVKVMKIEDYPIQNSFSGEDNVSKYPFIGYIEQQTNLQEFSYMEIRKDQMNVDLEAIYLENAYIRELNGKQYVMKNQDGKLVRQEVKVGRVFGGQISQIVEGISLADEIAFPYGDGWIEGIKALSQDSGVKYE